MEKFKQYLTDQQLQPSTIEEDSKNVFRFIHWLKTQRLDIEQIVYNDLLSYIRYQRGQHILPATINLRLNSIRKYFDYLKKEGEIERNPAKTLHVKGSIQQVIQNPLSREELEALYYQYTQLFPQAHRQKQVEHVHARNTAILGLLIWQGIHSGELQKIETGHIRFDEGKIYIPSTNQSNNRQLPLSQKQVIALHQYIFVTRSYFEPQGDELITGSLRNIITQLVAQLQGINPVITNALHIRGSVILNWLKVHSKREVQYMAGHKYISSTEKYASQETDSLQDELSKHHPFG
jgi:integrase/recombinase XerD